MQIILLIFISISLVWGIKKKSLVFYCTLVCMLLPSIYFFISLPSAFDLSRHYEYFNILESMSFEELFNNNDSIVSLLLKNEPIYVFGVWGISRLHIKELMPVIVGIITYSIPTWILLSIKRNTNASLLAFSSAFVFIMLTTDFIAISGIRNILAASIFIYAFYNEYVLQRRQVLSILMYALSFLIHSSMIIFIGIRVLHIFYKNFKILINIFLFAVFSILPLMLSDLYILFAKIPKFVMILRTYENYYRGWTGNFDRRGAQICSLVLYSMGMVLAIYLKHKYDKNPQICRITEFYTMSFLFILGSIQQYDIFIRFRFISIPLTSMLVLFFFSENKFKSILRISGTTIKNARFRCVLLLSLLLSVIMQASYYFLFSYYPITQYIR